MADYTNAAPMVFDQGTNDKSTVPQVIQALTVPQHLPKIYIWAEKGQVGPAYVDLNTYSLTELYGADTFDATKKFYNHSTVFLEKIAAQGNSCVVHRFYPDDGTGPANVTLSIDLTFRANIPVYQKAVDGSFSLDSSGLPIQVSTMPGYEASWLATHEGGVIPPINGTTVRYPIFEIRASSFGTCGNKIGVSLAPRLRSDAAQFPDSALNADKNYPYTFALKKIADPLTGKVEILPNNYNSKQISFFLDKRKQSEYNENSSYIDNAVNDAYVKFYGDNNRNDLGYFKVHDDNIAIVCKSLYDTEILTADSHRDPILNGNVGNEFCMNIINFTSSNGSPYNSVKVVATDHSVRLSKDAIVMLKGGTDGTINDAAYDALVSEDIDRYEDFNDEYMDLVMHPESHMYDTGFSIPTKLKLAKFISYRKDTYIVYSSHVAGEGTLSIAQQISLAQSIQDTFMARPESAIFGTPAMRASIIAGSCLLLNSNYDKRVPVSIEMAIKSAKYMGDSSGKWRNGFIFDSAPGSVLSNVYDIDVTWTPANVKNLLWADGLTFVGNYNQNAKQFLAMKTVYSNDTSILNSYFTATAICYINKVEHAAWREFTGNITLTAGQFVDNVRNFVALALKDKFDGKVVLIPEVKITGFDDLRGYSWTLNVSIGANGMKTVATTSVEAYRATFMSF